jgi:hypothetical protein
MCTQNLHLLTCRAHEQEEQRGSLYHETELWLERVLQWLKSRVKYHTTAVPEKIMAKFVLLDMALTCLRSRFPTLKSFDEWIPAYRSRQLAGPQFDDNYQSPNRMLFAGKPPARPGAARGHNLCWETDIKPAAAEAIRDANGQGRREWQPSHLDQVQDLKVGHVSPCLVYMNMPVAPPSRSCMHASHKAASHH